MRAIDVTRSGIAGTVLALVIAGVCARLGVWQLDRLEQRRDRNSVVAERMAVAPLPLPALLADTTGLAYRRVTLAGQFDEERSVVLRGRVHRGTPGIFVVTPLRLAGGGYVMVNRGWLPAPDAATADLDAYAEPGRVELHGLVLPFPVNSPGSDAPDAADADARGAAGLWLRLDAGALRRRLPYPIHDVYVQALPGEASPVLPARLPPPELGDGPHLNYAVQWFGFAAVALLGWGVIAMRRGIAQRRESSQP